MTLINYLTRIHFGDGVLEEALWAEIEHNGKRRPLIIANAQDLTGGLAERFFAGGPADLLTIAPSDFRAAIETALAG